MRRALLVVTVCLVALLPVSSALGSASSAGTGLPKTVCDKAQSKLKKAQKKVKKAKTPVAKRKAKKKVKKAQKRVAKKCLDVRSSAFKNGKTIPTQYTCIGLGVSPPLAWKAAKASAAGLPKGTTELALTVEDPDAPGGTFVHWVVYGIPSGTAAIAENSVPPGAVQGVNNFGTSTYGPPCPPRGDGPHRYFFTVFALSSPLGLGPNATADQVRSAAKGKTKAAGQLMGRYERS